jgi:hypothetical protein
VKTRGSPGSPEAMRDVSQVAVTGMTGSSMNRSCMANFPLVDTYFEKRSGVIDLIGWEGLCNDWKI